MNRHFWQVVAGTSTCIALLLSTPAFSNVAWEYYSPFAGNSVSDIPKTNPTSIGQLPNFSNSPGVADRYALRFKAFIRILSAGDYTFFTTSDDGSALSVDSAKVVDNDGPHGDQERSGTVTLTQGLHSIEVLYMQLGGGSSLSVSWQGPGIGKQTIPDSLLVPGFAVKDAAPDLLLKPTGLVSDSVLAPQVRVRNMGSEAASFSVFCSIDSADVHLYRDSQTVTGLSSFQTQVIAFKSWRVPVVIRGNYLLTFRTVLAGDMVPANDTLRTVMVVQYMGLTAFPKQLQLYCRDSHDSAVVPVAGFINKANADSVSITVYKNNVKTMRLAQKLSFSGTTANFSFSPKIHAELAMYKFELRFDTLLFSTVDSVVCGDAFLVEGQSNSCQGNFEPPHPFVRTFGYWGGNLGQTDSARVVNDSVWHVADSGWLSVNGWGFQIAKKIIDASSIPVCLINGGVGGTAIEAHVQSTSLNSIYGKYRYRILKANLQNGLKWVIWHQGESNPGDLSYKTQFLALCNSWKADFPGIQHYYLFQIRPGCNAPLETVRELQRLCPQGRPDISIMATTNIPDHDGCHFYQVSLGHSDGAGYPMFAKWMYPLIARDFYKSTDTVHIRPPDVQQAWFANSARTRIVVKFDQPVIVPTDTFIRHAFAMGTKQALMDSIKADTLSNTITLFMRTRSDSATLTYVIDTAKGSFTGQISHQGAYDGPWLYNTRGIGALTFYRFPVLDSSKVATCDDRLAHEAGLNAVVGPLGIDIRSKGEHAVMVYALSGKLLMAERGKGPARYRVRERLGTGTYVVQVVTPLQNVRQKLFVY